MRYMTGQVTVLMCQCTNATHGWPSDCANAPLHECDTRLAKSDNRSILTTLLASCHDEKFLVCICTFSYIFSNSLCNLMPNHLPRQFCAHKQLHWGPVLPFKLPDVSSPILAARDKAQPMVSPLDAVHTVWVCLILQDTMWPLITHHKIHSARQEMPVWDHQSTAAFLLFH